MYQDSDTSFVYFLKGCKIGKCSNAYGSKLYLFRINNKLEIIDSTLIDKGLDFSSSSKTWPYIEPSNGNNYILTWRDNLAPMVNYYEPYVCKLDNKGNQIWKTKFKINDNYSYDKSINNVITLKNGDYLLIGTNLLSPIKSLGFNAGWATRINTNGEIIWERNYYNKVPPNFPIKPILQLFDGVEGGDGSIYMCGFLFDSIPGISPPQPNANNWVIKVGPDGCLTPGCTDSLIYVATTEVKNLKQDLLQILPNLANHNITAFWKDAFTEANHIIIRNIEGSLLKDLIVQGKAGQAYIDIKNLPSGMYITTIQGKGWQSMPVKFVKQ